MHHFKFRYLLIYKKKDTLRRKYSFSINELYNIFRNIFPAAKKGRIDLQTSCSIHTFQIRIARFQLFYVTMLRAPMRMQRYFFFGEMQELLKQWSRVSCLFDRIGKKWWIDCKLKSFGIKALVCKFTLFFGLSFGTEEEELAYYRNIILIVNSRTLLTIPTDQA